MMNLDPITTEAFRRGYDTAAYKAGYEAGFAAGRASAGPPSLAAEQCPGGGKPPDHAGIKTKSSGHPGRGRCKFCGTEFKLNWNGYVRRHRKKIKQ